MKLMYLIPGIGGGGGAEKSLAAMIPHWTDKMDVHVVTFSDRNALGAEFEADGARVTNLEATSRRDLLGQLVELMRGDRPDLVHTTLWEADIIGRLAALRTGTPVSSSLVNVNYGPQQRRGRVRQLPSLVAAQFADATTAQLASGFHALTDHVATTMARRLFVRRSRIQVIPRGRSDEKLGRRTPERRSVARAEFGIGSEPVVLAAARHERQKGLDTLVGAIPKVLEIVPNARFLIGGRSGRDTAMLHDLAAALGVEGSLDFIGPRDDVPDLMCAADVFCVPSRWEGFGSILVEAMALEVPTVATDIGAIRDVARSADWLSLFEPEQPHRLAATIVATLSDPVSASARAGRGRQLFEKTHTASAVASSMMDFFELARPRPAEQRRRRALN